MELLIILGTILISGLVACFLAAKQMSNHTFQCKKCLKEFNPNWKKVIFAIHSDNEYEIRCPNCNSKGCIDKFK